MTVVVVTAALDCTYVHFLTVLYVVCFCSCCVFCACCVHVCTCPFVPKVAFLHLPSRYIYYLITKQRYYHRPTLATLQASSYSMKQHMRHGVMQLAMPKIGCGLGESHHMRMWSGWVDVDTADAAIQCACVCMSCTCSCSVQMVSHGMMSSR